MSNIYGDNEQFVSCSKIGNNAVIGSLAQIGNNVRIEDGADIGGCAKIGYNADIGNNVRIKDGAVIGRCAKIGNFAKMGAFTQIGSGARIGDNAVIGNNAEIGYGAKIGDKFQCEGLKVIDFFTMANVDGSGRSLHIYVHTDGISVRAGCFKGTLDEFCTKAEAEEKYLYSVTVRAAAEAFAAEVHRQGKTGGWDKE